MSKCIDKRVKIYVFQWDTWYAMTPALAEHLLLAIKHGGSWNLGDYAERLTRRPSCIYRDRDGHGKSRFYNYSTKHLYWHMPCDWQYLDMDWLEANAQITDLLRWKHA
jgi:hypothetical protein